MTCVKSCMSQTVAMPTILVVEDQDHIREAVILILSIEGYKTVGANNGAEGLLIVYKDRPKLILCDVTMPVMDGFQMLEKLRQNPELSTTPFVFMSARTDEKNISRAQELGVEEFLPKPVWPPDLMRVVHKYLP
jgi:CheY-like chemotaxis protein